MVSLDQVWLSSDEWKNCLKFFYGTFLYYLLTGTCQKCHIILVLVENLPSNTTLTIFWPIFYIFRQKTYLETKDEFYTVYYSLLEILSRKEKINFLVRNSVWNFNIFHRYFQDIPWISKNIPGISSGYY